MNRIFYLKCKRCNEMFYSKCSTSKYCDRCKEEINFISKHTCSMCKKFDENLTRDQNGRGYECGCHDLWNKNHWQKFNKSQKANEIRKNNAKILLNSSSYKEHIKNHNKKLAENKFLFKNKNVIIFYYDVKSKKYVQWEEYKRKFKINNVKIENFEIIPTFRSQDSKNWYGSKKAFEKYLEEMKIGWFIYIKFYLNDKNEVKPLVIGKTGSLLVNSSGTDVSFSICQDSPARKFLNENNFKWDKTKIAIKRCKDENEAYNLEKELTLKYQLFNS